MSSKQKLIGNRTHGLTFVVSAPAGTGKSTLVDMLMQEFDEVKRSISCTTRAKRENEVDGVDYSFVTKEEFEKKIAKGGFLEYVTLFGDYYGTSKDMLEKMKATGKHVVLVIDTQGALQLMGKEKAIFIFIMPPSFEELARRLQDRGSETRESLSTRLKEAEREIATASSYTYVIVNDDLQIAYQALKGIVIAEEHRVT